MATNDNQYRYLTNLSQGRNPDGSKATAGNIAWAKNQLATYKPPQTQTKATPAQTTTKQTTPTLGQGETYVRKFLTDSGYRDDQIGYDPQRKTVLLDGKDFITPTKNIGGYTAASTADLNKALSDFRNRDLTNKTYDVLSRIETAINTPYQAPEFNYDPNTDPVYQAALRRAQANAATASGNAMAELNRRGILNSTITGDRVAQIQQSELGRVSDEVLPQLFAQAYNRYRDTVGDQQAAYRNRIADLTNLLGLNTGLVDRDREYEQQQWENRFNYGQAVGQFNNGQPTMERRIFDRGVFESDRDYNRGVLESDRNYNLDRARESRLASGGGSGGGSSGGSSSSNGVISDFNMPRTVDSMITWVINHTPGYGDLFGPPPPDMQAHIENLILSNPNLSDKQITQLYQRFGIPLPQ